VVRWRLISRVGLAVALVSVLGGSQTATAGPRRHPGDHPKLDRKLNDRDRAVTKLGGRLGRRLSLVNGLSVELPNRVLRTLADHPAVARITWDRPLDSTMNRVSVTVGARAVQSTLGLTGAGVGVAVIDSGVTGWHDDLTYRGSSPLVRVKNGQRVAAFVDFVNGRTAPYDSYGHGTHVAGIIGGNGYDTFGSRAGIAPDAHLVSLRVLDGNGRGVISSVIGALEWAITNRVAYNIRVINLSVGAAVTESYKTDLLAHAAKRAVDAGIVVVAAAGNLGRNSLGQTQYGGITAPGNAPWVLTVGASSHMGTVDRSDDTIGGFSSRGPTAIDISAKPDVVAPGVGIESLSDPGSLLYSARAGYLLPGTVTTPVLPYLSLSGTSMSAPVVSGTVALMLQANPSLTPNAVKAILQYTAQFYRSYDPLTQGAGFLNAKGAVELARYLGSPSTLAYPSSRRWGRRLIWGNRQLQGGRLSLAANAWSSDVIWGSETTAGGEAVSWGVQCSTAWCDSASAPWRWDTAPAVNIVWGPTCGGDDCGTPWTGGAIWGTTDEGDTVVWGTADEGDTVVWGTAADEDTVVWGTSCSDVSCDPVIWKSP
jgi:serine protease AprX